MHHYDPIKMYDDSAVPMRYNIFARQYEHEHTREEIIKACRHFNLVQWDCTAVITRWSNKESPIAGKDNPFVAGEWETEFRFGHIRNYEVQIFKGKHF